MERATDLQKKIDDLWRILYSGAATPIRPKEFAKALRMLGNIYVQAFAAHIAGIWEGDQRISPKVRAWAEIERGDFAPSQRINSMHSCHVNQTALELMEADNA